MNKSFCIAEDNLQALKAFALNKVLVDRRRNDSKLEVLSAVSADAAIRALLHEQYRAMRLLLRVAQADQAMGLLAEGVFAPAWVVDELNANGDTRFLEADQEDAEALACLRRLASSGNSDLSLEDDVDKRAALERLAPAGRDNTAAEQELAAILRSLSRMAAIGGEIY